MEIKKTSRKIEKMPTQMKFHGQWNLSTIKCIVKDNAIEDLIFSEKGGQIGILIVYEDLKNAIKFFEEKLARAKRDLNIK